jgi:hypothetical protein
VVAGTLKGKEDEEMKREACHEQSNSRSQVIDAK